MWRMFNENLGESSIPQKVGKLDLDKAVGNGIQG